MKILYIKHKDSAVFNYRFDRPLKPLGAKFTRTLLRKSEKIRLDKLAKRYKRKCDVLAMKYVSDHHTLDVIYTIRNIGGFKVVVDIDDNIWDIPFGNPSRGGEYDNANRAMMVAESIRCADCVTVATEPLKNVVLPLNKNVTVLHNYIDPKEWNFKRKNHNKIRIGWVWSPTHLPDMPVVAGALRKIVKKYGDRIEIVMIGANNDMFEFKTQNIKSVKFDQYPKLLTEASIDISIAPLEDNDFNKCKSNIKFLESTMAGACFIGSNVYPYKKTISHGVNGMLAKNEKQWVTYLSRLIDNGYLRMKLLNNAEKLVLKDFSSGEHFEKFYNNLC